SNLPCSSSRRSATAERLELYCVHSGAASGHCRPSDSRTDLPGQAPGAVSADVLIAAVYDGVAHDDGACDFHDLVTALVREGHEIPDVFCGYDASSLLRVTLNRLSVTFR